MSPFLSTVFAGVLLTLSGVLLFLREIALNPQNVNLPPAPWWVRMSMAFFALLLVIVGTNTLFLLNVYPPIYAPTDRVLLSVGTFGYTAVTLINVLRQRYPARVWASLNKITTLASCRKPGSRVPEVVSRGVLDTLAHDGFTVAPPYAGPESLSASPETVGVLH